MSDVIGKASIAIDADSTNFAKQAESGVMSGMKKVAGTIAAAFAATQVFDFLKDAALLAEQAATANTRLETTLKNAGDAAGQWSSRQIELAESLSMTTGVHDEVIKQGQAILGTFHSLASTAGETGGAFDRATIAAVDLSAAGFGSVESASTMLGKALEDPAKGMTALTRVGVTFTDGQKEQIEAMMAAGDAASAQAIILEAVESQVGGVAEATADASAIAAVGWQNVKEQVGTLLLPVLQALAGFVVDVLLPAIESFVDWIETSLVPALQSMKQWIEDNSTTIATVAGIITAVFLPALAMMGIQALINAAKVVVSWVMQTASAAASLAAQAITFAALGVWYVWLGIQAVVNAAKVVLGWVMQQTAALASKAVQAGVFIWQGIQWALAGARALVGAAIQVGAWVMTGVAAMANAVIIAAAWLIAMGPVGWVIAAVIAVVAIFAVLWVKLEGFREFWINLWEVVSAWFVQVWESIKAFFAQAVESIRAGIQSFVDRVKAIWAGIVDLVNKAREVLSNLWQAFKDGVQRIIDGVTGWVGNIVEGFRSAVGRVVEIGKNIVQGIWDGIQSMGGWIKDKVIGFVSNIIPGPIKSALGIASPSKVTAALGKEVSRGLAVGIETEAKVVRTATEGVARLAVPAPISSGPGPLGASASSSAAAPVPSTSIGSITVNLSMDDLEQLRSLDDFLKMLHKQRLDSRRGEKVVV